jgi:hypothetical protein
MTYFLEYIAHSLYKEFGNTLNRHCLVFPSRRAGLYFLKYLAAGIEKPVWTPSIVTINELFHAQSSLQIAGNEILLFELYKVYCKFKTPHESFDDFYFWGDMLLNDFDDIDKYMVNASLLFTNVKDIKDIDQQFGGLTEDQVQIIKRFWTNFNQENLTKEKAGFIGIWSILSDLYSGFRIALKDKNLAYEGMIFRDVAEGQQVGDENRDRWDLVHFIGFNALNNCEKMIMSRYKDVGKARFYWDFDNSYIKEGTTNSAGLFLNDDLNLFGNDMPEGWSYDTMLSKSSPDVFRRVIDTSSDIAQVKLVTKLLASISDISPDNAHHTAVILADENLLMPLLTSLPDSMGDINITMGHPLKQTLVYTFLKHLIDLQRNAVEVDGMVKFTFREVVSILKHSLISGLLDPIDNELVNVIVSKNMVKVPAEVFSSSGQLISIFRKPDTPSELSLYFKEILSVIAKSKSINKIETSDGQVQSNILNEYIYRIVLSINKLETIVKSPEISFSPETYFRILDRLLRMQSVPFSGEPLTGIQIMGILETRTLDFRNLIILSVNEGILPAAFSGSSFIPFSLREAFGLPSVNHQESIYAYHFYRLLQRAENVTFLYNSSSEGLQTGEMSRFLMQMKYDELLRPVFTDLGFEIKSHAGLSDSIERNEEHIRQLQSLYTNINGKRILSPSAINTWLECRMKFYYRYVERLKEPDDISLEIDPAMLGNILHETMRKLYEPFLGGTITAEMISSMLNDTVMLSKSINSAVNEAFKAGRNDEPGGSELIVRDVLLIYLRRILNNDRSIAPIVILSLEKSFSFELQMGISSTIKEIIIGGNIDRIDSLNKVTRIVDYKTGIVSESIGSISDLFADDRKKDIDAWLQTLIYCEAYLATKPGGTLRPSVYKIRKLNRSSPGDMLKIKTGSHSEILIDNYETVREDFLSGLKGLVSIIFSNNEPFIKTTDARVKCSFCPYKTLCLR